MPRLIAGLLDVSRKSFLDESKTAGLIFSMLFESVTPLGMLVANFVAIVLKLWLIVTAEALNPNR